MKLELKPHPTKARRFLLYIDGVTDGLYFLLTEEGMYDIDYYCQVGFSTQHKEKIMQMNTADFTDRLSLHFFEDDYHKRIDFINMERRSGLFIIEYGVEVAAEPTYVEKTNERLIWGPRLFIKKLGEISTSKGLLPSKLWLSGDEEEYGSDTYTYQCSIGEQKIIDKIDEGMAILEECMLLAHEQLKLEVMNMTNPFYELDDDDPEL